MSPVNSRAAKTKIKEKAKSADNTLLLRLTPGISATDVKKLLHERGLKAKKVFSNLSKSKEQVYLSVEPLKKDAAMTAEEIQSLTAAPEIDSADLNYEIHLVERNPYTTTITGGEVNRNAVVKPTAVQPAPALAPEDPRYSELWGMANMEMEAAWNIETGSKKSAVFVIDTGIDTDHPDLVSNLWWNPGEIPSNGIDDDGNGYVDDVHGIDAVNYDSDPEDDHGHGTHVSGTIGAQANNAAGVAGVNWEVNIGACKFLDAGGGGSTEGAVQCFDYVLGLKNAGLNVVATNNSWGGGGFSQVLLDAIEANINAGILPVIAAGNSASNNDSWPAYPCSYSFPNAQGDSLCVAAIDSSNNLAGFSNYGLASVDLAAPGVNILSSVPELVDASGYASWSGTSMATPHVTGLAALLAANRLDSTLSEIREMILCGAVPTESLAGKVVTGGRANAYRSLQWNCSFPTVTITAPKNLSSVSGVVVISAEASSSAGVAQVDFYVDGSPVSADAVPPYSAVWNSAEAAPGSHVIKAVATDAQGMNASAQVKVYVTSSCSDKQALILDLGSTNSSCDAIAAALTQNNINPVHESSIGSINPAVYPLTFICLGYDTGSKHVLTAEESASLSAYLDNGGMLYMEGGDTWAYDPKQPVLNYFGISGVADGGFDLATISGLSGSLAEGLSFTASGTNAWVDHLEAVNGGAAVWQNSSPVYVAGVSNQTPTYRTIGCSFEFGNIPDEATQTQVMAAYLSFFDYVSDGSGCPNSDVIDFEEAITSLDGKIPDGYKGLNWGEYCYGLDPVGYGLDPSGFVNGITSGKYILANPGAETCIITSPSDSVTFDGGYFTAAWSDGLQLTVNGYSGGTSTGSVNTTIDTTGPTWVNLAPLGAVDRLEITGFDSSMGWNSHFALDDLKIHTGTVTHVVTPSAGTGGGISPDASQTVNHGATASFTVTPDTGYSIDKVEGCGGSLSGNVYTTAPVTADCAVTATFISNTIYIVTPKVAGQGTITPATPQQVHKGRTASFTITPNAGYLIKSVTGCGGTLSGSIYTTGPVTKNCTVQTSFVKPR
ncbi:MAG: S8 family serine peptidase [Candidatus Electronema sp. VV]